MWTTFSSVRKGWLEHLPTSNIYRSPRFASSSSECHVITEILIWWTSPDSHTPRDLRPHNLLTAHCPKVHTPEQTGDHHTDFIQAEGIDVRSLDLYCNR